MFFFQVSKNQLEKLTINTRYHPPNITSPPVSQNYTNNNQSNNFNNNNNNSQHQQHQQNGSNCQIGNNTNAVTVVKVNQLALASRLSMCNVFSTFVVLGREGLEGW